MFVSASSVATLSLFTINEEYIKPRETEDSFLMRTNRSCRYEVLSTYKTVPNGLLLSQWWNELPMDIRTPERFKV